MKLAGFLSGKSVSIYNSVKMPPFLEKNMKCIFACFHYKEMLLIIREANLSFIFSFTAEDSKHVSHFIYPLFRLSFGCLSMTGTLSAAHSHLSSPSVCVSVLIHPCHSSICLSSIHPFV